MPEQKSKLDAKNVEDLLGVLISREARQAAKEEAEEAARVKREAQRAHNAASNADRDLVRQARCTHLKGGKHRRRNQAKDYGVYLHTYIDRSRVIKCFICKMNWKPGDTKEFLMREGKKKPNHTKIGWVEAVAMLEQSSNQPSSSEIPGPSIQNDDLASVTVSQIEHGATS